MEKLSSAILEKVKGEADAIIKEAEAQAVARIKAAQDQRQVRSEEQKKKLLSEAGAEASRILAQAAIGARQETLGAKTAVVSEIMDGVKSQLGGLSGNEKVLSALAREGIKALGAQKVRLYVSSKDLPAMQKLVREDSSLASAVIEVKKQESLGGVIIEDAEGKNRIDNTFDTRLEMLLPRLLPEIQKELF